MAGSAGPWRAGAASRREGAAVGQKTTPSPFHPSSPLSRSVAGTVRSPAKAAALAGAGIPAHALDLGAASGGAAAASLTPQLAAALAASTHLVATAPPALLEGGRGSGTITPHDPVLAALGPALASLAPSLTWAAYVSSTSVYGDDRAGAWVGEEDAVGPSTAAGAARVSAEAAWRAWAAGAGVGGATFRAGGIYGPGRAALDVAGGGGARAPGAGARRRDAEGSAAKPTSRVHVADLARGLLAAARAGGGGAWTVYNAVDADPAPRAEVVAAARALLEGGGGGTAAAAAAPALRPEPATGKRVRGARFAGLLAGEGGLLYPTYREGLAGILEAGGR